VIRTGRRFIEREHFHAESSGFSFSGHDQLLGPDMGTSTQSVSKGPCAVCACGTAISYASAGRFGFVGGGRTTPTTTCRSGASPYDPASPAAGSTNVSVTSRRQTRRLQCGDGTVSVSVSKATPVCLRLWPLDQLRPDAGRFGCRRRGDQRQQTCRVRSFAFKTRHRAVAEAPMSASPSRTDTADYNAATRR